MAGPRQLPGAGVGGDLGPQGLVKPKEQGSLGLTAQTGGQLILE